MAAEQGHVSNADAFDAYFRKADLDHDGRISGTEAVAFFQGSNLPKETLALVWSYAAGGNNFLGRMEFFNALKLVTVAQTGRQLTADIVKAALYGPAAAKIPAPKINPTSASQGQINSITSSPQPNQMVMQPNQTGFFRPPASLINSMAAPLPQASNLMPQSSSTGFVQLPTSQMTSASLPESSQLGFMRPPSSQMNSMTTVSPQTNSMMHQPLQTDFFRPLPQANNMPMQPVHAGFMGPSSSQIASLIGQPTAISLQNNFTRPPQASQVGRSSGPQTLVALNFADKDGFGIADSTQEPKSKPQIQDAISTTTLSRSLDTLSTSFQTTSKDPKVLAASGNDFSSDSLFGGDVFSATQTKQDASAPISSTSGFSSSFNLPPIAPRNSINPVQDTNLQGGLLVANQLQRAQPLVKQDHQNTMQKTSPLPVYNVPSGSDISTSQNEISWQKISQSDIRKYTKVFLEVDKDRDGKITGQEARNLFLSWKLPREVLRQVWDLSDQDNDSMLSMREFCISLYLMERYREGRSLPSTLPNSVKFDQTLILATGQPPTYGPSAWQPRPFSSQQPILEPSSAVPLSRMEASTIAPTPSQSDNVVPPVQQKSRVPILEQNMVNQLSEEEQKALNSKLQEATDADNKVQELEKEILNCKQKTETYRKQMQELVLYKSRCDSRLNETIERTAADKREVDLLARKYEEKYKQTKDATSIPNVDQATFRDIQERKMQLYNAIVKMEQGEMSDGVLQERAEKIQTDLNELVKTLNDWCKESGLRSKPTSLVELPFGWQPGVQEGAADWDESWDKFDKDDGFTIIKEFTLEVEYIIAPEKQKPILVTSAKELPSITSIENDIATQGDTSPFTKVEEKTEKSLATGELLTDSESSNVRGDDDEVRSPSDSPGKFSLENPSQEFQSIYSPHAHEKEHHSELDGPESTAPGEKFTDEATWGATFDSDDTDSLWGFNPIRTKQPLHEESTQYSPSAASIFGKERPPFFDSVPSTPLFSSVLSPKFNEGPDDRSFDSFSRFDSFSTQDSIFPPARTLARFDSIGSTADPPRDAFSRFDSFGADTQKGFARFDSIRSTADPSRDASFSRFDSFSSNVHTQKEFARFDSIGSAADPPRDAFSRFDSFGGAANAQGGFARFDSMKSSAGEHNHGFSFDDSDPFGSGPFKTSDNHTPKKSAADQWSSF